MTRREWTAGVRGRMPMRRSFAIGWAITSAVCPLSSVEGFLAVQVSRTASAGRRFLHTGSRRPTSTVPRWVRLALSAGNGDDDAFQSFADSLEEGDGSSPSDGAGGGGGGGGTATAYVDTDATTGEEATTDFSDLDTDEVEDDMASWQESLEMLLDPTTPLAKRQILFSDLMGANDEIRAAVTAALREGKVDPLLTPTGKKIQDGTRAVSRQLAMDILPGIADAVRASTDGMNGGSPAQKIADYDLPSLVPKIGERVLDAFSTQARKQFDLLRGDLADPTRIPKRLSKQTAELATEARNVFRETPEGLAEPPYVVESNGVGYEIRLYEGYTAAATSMAEVGETFSEDDLAKTGAAFNAIAAYLFGANVEERSMAMTTPVSTTSAGEMRFYLNAAGTAMESFPTPLAVEDKVNEKGAVKLLDVAPARLAVARFTGFVTAGEVARQKDKLLNALAMDGVELDVPHGAVVPYVIFQYNPPYTIPIVRRNEIAIPVRAAGDSPVQQGSEWDDPVEAPSDVE